MTKKHAMKNCADPTPTFMLLVMAVNVSAGILLTHYGFNWQVSFGVFGLLTILSWKFSLYEIPATPHMMGILKFMGRPIGVLKKRGLRLIPFKGWIFGFDLIELDVSAQELEINDLVLTTPDDGIQTPPAKLAVTWRPDTRDAESLLEFHDYSHGGHPEEINDFLKEIVVERARNYANSPVEGPKTIEELVRSTIGINHAIIKTLAEGVIPTISSKVPDEVLIDWHQHPGGSLRASIRKDWGTAGNPWEKVERILAREDRAKIIHEIRQRIHFVNRVSSGRGEVRVPWLGIVIEKVAVDEIKEPAALADARLLKKKASEQNAADKERLDALRMRLAEYMGVEPEKVKLTREQAVSFIASGGKLVDWKLLEEKKTFEAGSTLAAVLEKMGIKIAVETAGGDK